MQNNQVIGYNGCIFPNTPKKENHRREVPCLSDSQVQLQSFVSEALFSCTSVVGTLEKHTVLLPLLLCGCQFQGWEEAATLDLELLQRLCVKREAGGKRSRRRGVARHDSAVLSRHTFSLKETCSLAAARISQESVDQGPRSPKVH